MPLKKTRRNTYRVLLFKNYGKIAYKTPKIRQNKMRFYTIRVSFHYNTYRVLYRF